MKKTIAIVLATYNGEQWMDEQLRSIRQQSHPDWQLWVRDDQSRDGTLDIARRHAVEDARIRVTLNSVRSGSAARNFMAALLEVELDTVEFVAFCDQDDVWAPGRLQRALDQLGRHEADGYSGDLIAFDNGRQQSQYVRKNRQQQPFDHLFQSASAGCTYVISRKAAQVIVEKLRRHPGGMAADKSHDWLVYAICRSAGLRWVHDDTAQLFYRQHAGNVYGANSRWAGVQKRLRMVRSGWYREQILWNAHFFADNAAEQTIVARVRRFGFVDRLRLISQVRQFRRDLRQALLLGLLLLLGWM